MILKNFYLSIFILLSLNTWSLNIDNEKDYCVGYFEELYWSLDPIEEEKIRNEIKAYFNQNYSGSEKLDFDLYYNTKTKQFITDWQNTDVSKYIKVNYPNFEIIILDAYINLFIDGENYCPAFWDRCSEESLNYFFKAAEDFSKDWQGEDEVLFYLENNLKNHQCSKFLNTSINQKKFISHLNILIKELTN